MLYMKTKYVSFKLPSFELKITILILILFVSTIKNCIAQQDCIIGKTRQQIIDHSSTMDLLINNTDKLVFKTAGNLLVVFEFGDDNTTCVSNYFVASDIQSYNEFIYSMIGSSVWIWDEKNQYWFNSGMIIKKVSWTSPYTYFKVECL